jgi:RNA polymerase sigma-70 factor, ECF subfamily
VSDPDRRETSFEELALPLCDSLYSFARWLARDETTAEDLVQETYLKALRSFSSFTPGTNFKAWMFRILRNTFLNARQAALRWEPLDEGEANEPAAPAEETPESRLLSRARTDEVVRALETLPSRTREILLLREAEELSYAELAEVLELPVGTVMSRLFRARSALRAAIEGARR